MMSSMSLNRFHRSMGQVPGSAFLEETTQSKASQLCRTGPPFFDSSSQRNQIQFSMKWSSILTNTDHCLSSSTNAWLLFVASRRHSIPGRGDTHPLNGSCRWIRANSFAFPSHFPDGSGSHSMTNSMSTQPSWTAFMLRELRGY